jgi:hypothetical protein
MLVEQSGDLVVGCLVRFVTHAELTHQNNKPDTPNERDKLDKNPHPFFTYIAKPTNRNPE